MSKIKPIRDLYFRFIKDTDLDGTVNAQQVAHALQLEGYVELLPHNTEPILGHYTDTDKLRTVPLNEVEMTVNRCLALYILEKGLK